MYEFLSSAYPSSRQLMVGQPFKIITALAVVKSIHTHARTQEHAGQYHLLVTVTVYSTSLYISTQSLSHLGVIGRIIPAVTHDVPAINKYSTITCNRTGIYQYGNEPDWLINKILIASIKKQSYHRYTIINLVSDMNDLMCLVSDGSRFKMCKYVYICSNFYYRWRKWPSFGNDTWETR